MKFRTSVLSLRLPLVLSCVTVCDRRYNSVHQDVGLLHMSEASRPPNSPPCWVPGNLGLGDLWSVVSSEKVNSVPWDLKLLTPPAWLNSELSAAGVCFQSRLAATMSYLGWSLDLDVWMTCFNKFFNLLLMSKTINYYCLILLLFSLQKWSSSVLKNRI